LLEECYNDDHAISRSAPPLAGGARHAAVAGEARRVLDRRPAVADSITGEQWNRYIFRTGRSVLSGCVGQRRGGAG